MRRAPRKPRLVRSHLSCEFTGQFDDAGIETFEHGGQVFILSGLAFSGGFLRPHDFVDFLETAYHRDQTVDLRPADLAALLAHRQRLHPFQQRQGQRANAAGHVTARLAPQHPFFFPGLILQA